MIWIEWYDIKLCNINLKWKMLWWAFIELRLKSNQFCMSEK